MKNRYPIDQSPLFRLKTRVKLAALLGLTADELQRFCAEQEAQYDRFKKDIIKNGKTKTRYIERPKPPLRRIQKRISELLNRITPPPYLHSGVSGRSYISNASQHDTGTMTPCAKIDIRDFFRSAYAGYIFRSFVDVFECSDDVSACLMCLTSTEHHIPTGGNSSTIISFYAFKPMFDEIYDLASTRGLMMTCCVDDMSFTGTAATSGFLNEVRLIVEKYRLKTHKRRCFKAGQPRIVTGVALASNGMRIPNLRRRKLHEVAAKFAAAKDPEQKFKFGQELLGRVTEAAQIEDRFAPLVERAAEDLSTAKRALQ